MELDIPTITEAIARRRPDAPCLVHARRTFTWAHMVPGMFSPCGTMQMAGGSYQWARDQLSLGEREAAAALGPLTVLVNNASVFLDDRVGALGRETWDAHLEVNLRAPLVLAEAFAAQAPDGSCIVNLLDQRVLRPNPQFFSYAVSKAGLWFATRTLAQALAPRIRVNGVGPGPTLPSIHQSPAQFEAEATHTPLGRRATPRDIAAAVLYLIDAPGVTGQMIAVDGGQHLAWRTPDIVEQGL